MDSKNRLQGDHDDIPQNLMRAITDARLRYEENGTPKKPYCVYLHKNKFDVLRNYLLKTIGGYRLAGKREAIQESKNTFEVDGVIVIDASNYFLTSNSSHH